MKKNEIKIAVEAMTKNEELNAFAVANSIVFDADASKSIDENKAALISLGEDDAPALDFAAKMAAFNAARAVEETAEKRVKRIVAEICAKVPGVNVVYENVKCNSKAEREKKEGWDRLKLGTDHSVPTMNAEGTDFIAIKTVSVSIISLGAALVLAGYGNVVRHITEHPEAAEDLMTDSTFDLVTSLIMKGEVYGNPFSATGRTVTAPTTRMEHYIFNLRLGPIGLDTVKDIRAKKLG